LIAAILLAASVAAPGLPKEQGELRAPDLVEIVRLDPTIRLDIRYATSANFIGRAVYTEARAFLQRPAAEALVRVHEDLRRQGRGLVVFDGYRPWSVTKLFWDLSSPAQRAYVANPQKGSKHNRGCAVDVSLYDVATGRPVEMTSDYDDMSARASPAYKGGTEDQRAERDRLRRAMEAQGFRVEPNEWWHFNYKEWRRYPILDVPFERLGSR
jgi:zinc D-Ala-D-Ala dipeptidase